MELLKLPPGPYVAPRVAPDGAHIAFGIDDGNEANIYTYRLVRRERDAATHVRREQPFPIWTANNRVAFQSDREGDLAISGSPSRVAPPNASPSPNRAPRMCRSPGLRSTTRFLFSVTKGADVSLWTYSLQDRTSTPFGEVHSSNPTNAVFSPDGRWVAYTRTERNRAMIYVQPFPASGAQHQLPVGAYGIASQPLWSPDGKELFYNPAPGRIRVGQRYDSTDDYVRESRDGAATVPNRFSCRAKGVRHHAGRQIRRFEPRRTNGVRYADHSADPGGPQLVRRTTGARAYDEVAILFFYTRYSGRSGSARIPHDSCRRESVRALRSLVRARRGRHGRGLSRARRDAQARRRAENPARRSSRVDPDRLARFKREAQVLASLNHPNIAAIYGFEASTLDRLRAGSPGARAGTRRGTDARRSHRARTDSRSTRRCRSRGRSPRRSKRRTSRASSTAISSPRTSRCDPTAR